MTLRSLILTLALLLALAPAAGAAEAKNPKSQAKTAKVTGCLDQSGTNYVLVGDTMLKRIARLEPVGFEKQSFAKYVGHKVELRGNVTGEGTETVVHVRSIKDISDMCVPDEP